MKLNTVRVNMILRELASHMYVFQEGRSLKYVWKTGPDINLVAAFETGFRPLFNYSPRLLRAKRGSQHTLLKGGEEVVITNLRFELNELAKGFHGRVLSSSVRDKTQPSDVASISAEVGAYPTRSLTILQSFLTMLS